MKRILLVLPLVLLCWAPAAHAQQTLPGICAIRSIAYGTTPATGSITVAGGQGCHRFTGARGEVVRVRLIRTSGTLDPTVGIAPPDGSTGCAATTDDEFRCVIRTAGQHTMVVRDVAGTATGTYALSIQRLNDPVGCATLSYATGSTAGALLPGEAGCWRFTGMRPDRVRIRVVTRSSALAPQIVVDQRGRSTCPPDAANPTCWLRRNGTHTIFVTDAAGPGAGDYSIAVQRLNDPVGCTTLAFGAAPRVGTIANDGETDCYRFTAAAGDRVHVRLEGTSAGLSPVGEVLNPDGTRACPPTTADESSCLLSAPSGTYTILAGDAAGTNNGDYAIAVQRLNNPVGCTPLAFATLPTPAAIGAAREVDCFRFDGAAGDRVRVSAITLAGDVVRAEVVGPDGSTRCSNGPRFTCALDSTGRHTLFVVSGSRVQTSTYSVLIQRLNDPVACRSIAFGSATIQTSVTWAAETDCYRLDGGPGAGAVARLVFTGSLRQHVVVVGPDGTQRCEARYPLPVLGFNCTFAGPHTILVEDDSGLLSGGYTIATQKANYCGGGDSLYPGERAQRRSISTGDVDCWDFGGLDAGRRLEVRLTRTAGALDPVAELLRPDGTRLCGPTTADEFVCVTDTTGGNHLLVGGTAAGATGTYEIEVS